MNPGTLLGPYRVESLLGAGGMGEVYLGIDTRLDRHVAIKFLSGQLAPDQGLRERFQREARTISSLNHPNICTLFDLGQHEGSDYLVMEYLQGETLSDRIAKGPLPTKEVVRIGLGIAAALEAAHRQGIIHRDLKPGNVMLTKGGVKLLDFGLAKIGVVATNSGPMTMALGETEHKPLTERGVILGTFQYMAPEQIEGLNVDARTDIFALGAILYEMATGHRAFDGKTRASLIAAIIDRDPPPMSELQPTTPLSLERLVRACLAKDPEERIQTAHDVVLQLRWLSDSSSIVEPGPVRRRTHLTRWLVPSMLALTTLIAGAMWWRERTRPAPAYEMSILPPRGTDAFAIALSPDGKTVAMSVAVRGTSERSLWLRRLDDGSLKQLYKGSASSLFWSPDGKWLGFWERPDRILRISVGGGAPETIGRSPLQNWPMWGRNGTILFSRRFGEGLFRVPASGGDVVPLTKLDASRNESIHTSPVLLPAGRRFLYLSRTIAEKRNEVWAGSLDGMTPRRVVVADALVGFSAPYLLTVRDGALYAQRFDDDALTVTGQPQRIIDYVGFFGTEAASPVSLAETGALTWAPAPVTRTRLNTYETNGALVKTLWEDDDFGQISMSRDGATLVVSRFDRTKGANDVYAVDLTRKVSTRVTGGLAAYMGPRISPDGESVAYYSDRQGVFDIFVQAIDGSAPARAVWKDSNDKFLFDWSPDGRHLLAGRFTSGAALDLWAVPMDGGQPWPFVSSESREADASFSPDGKWVAYCVWTGEVQELYLRPFPKGRAVRVSRDGGGWASWRADGRELVWSSHGRIMLASVDLSGPTPRIGEPREAFRLPHIWSRPHFTANGQIAVVGPAPDEDVTIPIHYTSNWRSHLGRGEK